MNNEHECIKCEHGVFNEVLQEWECKYANVPNREECNEDFVEYYFEAIETCPHCDCENAYPMWDVDVKGYVAICQHCGKEILLCDECIHAEDELNAHCMGCDWCETECGGKCFRGSTRD